MVEGVIGPSGFWSYVHKDNEQGGERILRLAERISDEFSLVTGDDLELFIDRDSLVWGDQWRIRVDATLQEVTFFIPIVTPRYFNSDECRKELMKFVSHARSLDALQLLLPILYVNVPDLADDSPDEAKSIIASTQYADWRDLRLTDEHSEDYTRAVSKLAARLADIARDYAAQPTVVPAATPEEGGSGDFDGEEPGLHDLIADMEALLPQWTDAIAGFSPIMERINAATTEATTAFEAADSFAKKVLAARRFSAALDEPADELQRQGERYASLLLGIDSGTRAVIAVAGEQEEQDDIVAACDMFDSLRELIAVSKENETSISELLTSMRAPAKMFKDVRPPFKKVEAGLRSVLDAQAVMDEWIRLMDESTLDCSAQPSSFDLN